MQSTGCLVINNYQVLLYNGLSLYGSMPLMLYALWDTWAAIMNFFNALLLDKVGRIPIMVVGQVCLKLPLCGTTVKMRISHNCIRSVVPFQLLDSRPVLPDSAEPTISLETGSGSSSSTSVSFFAVQTPWIILF